jgi:hypothetical protein
MHVMQLERNAIKNNNINPYNKIRTRRKKIVKKAKSYKIESQVMIFFGFK